MSLFILNVPGGLIASAHTHPGAVYAYILQGDIENQVEPDPPKIYHPGDFFEERPMQVHRLLRNLSKTEPAKILIFQNIGENSAALPPASKPLLQERLANMSDQKVSMLRLGAAPGASISAAHQHPGQVFAYVLKGEIQSQVDPEPPKIYRAGAVFYEFSHACLQAVSESEHDRARGVAHFPGGRKGPTACDGRELVVASWGRPEKRLL